jgi:hypothetical protein
MSNTLTIPTTITWNKLTTRPLTDEEKEEYNQQYGEGVIDFHWDGPTPYDKQFVLVYAEGWDAEIDQWVSDGIGCSAFDTNYDVDTIYWTELHEPPKPF